MSSSGRQQNTHSKHRLSISLRLPLLVISSFLVIITVVIVLVYFRFERRAVEEYTTMGKSVTLLMAKELDPDKTDLYLEENFRLPEYNQIRERFKFLKENYPDVMYMYVYHFVPEGGEVIFDLDSNYTLDADPPGTIYEPDPAVVPYIDDLCAGKQVPVLTGDTEDGYMLTYMRPVFDSHNNYRCHVCVDFSMEELHQEDVQFVMKLLVSLIIIMLLIAFIDIQLMQINITGPINRIKNATDSFSYESESDHQKNIQLMEKLDIKTGDEIEDIYHLFLTFMKNNLSYMQHLNQAESDIKDKDEKIGQISQEAYHDTLTGVGNKNAYKRKAADINSNINNGSFCFAVVMVDMNDLKKINDEHGHEAGDLYIKGCCHIVCEVFKHSPVFRIGGDEFVALLMGQDFDNRIQLTEMLRNSFEESFSDDALEPWLKYSAAVGIAESSPEDTSFEDVFKRADKAMYEDKKLFKALNGSYR